MSSLRPDPEHTGVVVGIARFEQRAVRFAWVPGTRDPAGDDVAAGLVRDELQPVLLAIFNGGFRFEDSRGGAFLNGREIRPLIAGAASLVIDADGRANVGAWGRDMAMSPSMVAVRQNLRLLVDNGHVDDGLVRNVDGAWGSKLNQGLYTTRSGVGIDGLGAVIYASGDGLTLSTLAHALLQAGAVRAMELDIHEEWVTFNFYQSDPQAPRGVRSTPLLTSMRRPPELYLSTPSDRDFVVAIVR